MIRHGFFIPIRNAPILSRRPSAIDQFPREIGGRSLFVTRIACLARRRSGAASAKPNAKRQTPSSRYVHLGPAPSSGTVLLHPFAVMSQSCEQVNHSIQAHVVYRVGRILLHDGLGVISNADAGLPQHFKIIGSIADSDNLLPFQPKFLAYLL